MWKDKGYSTRTVHHPRGSLLEEQVWLTNLVTQHSTQIGAKLLEYEKLSRHTSPTACLIKTLNIVFFKEVQNIEMYNKIIRGLKNIGIPIDSKLHQIRIMYIKRCQVLHKFLTEIESPPKS